MHHPYVLAPKVQQAANMSIMVAGHEVGHVAATICPGNDLHFAPIALHAVIYLPSSYRDCGPLSQNTAPLAQGHGPTPHEAIIDAVSNCRRDLILAAKALIARAAALGVSLSPITADELATESDHG